jgi:hypothetical protein
MATINSYAELREHLNGWLAEHGRSAAGAPHRAFWNTMSYQDFITKDVPSYRGVKILIKCDGLGSNIVQALMGNGLFAPGGDYPRMPPGGPYMHLSEVRPIIDWINNGCPEFKGAVTQSESGGESAAS